MLPISTFALILQLTEEGLAALAAETQKYYDIMTKFYCLRLALAPVLESLLILDKLLHLHEQVN